MRIATWNIERLKNYTELCMEIETPKGNLIVYGVIIGVVGNRNPSYNVDLERIVLDIKRLLMNDCPICICGDFNCSFSDGYYYTKHSRETLLSLFDENNINLLTENQSECVDHIAISDSFIGSGWTHVKEWNLDKKYSDHKGIYVDF